MLDAEVKGRLSGLCEGRLVKSTNLLVRLLLRSFSVVNDFGLRRNFLGVLCGPGEAFRNVMKVVGLRLGLFANLAFLALFQSALARRGDALARF